MNIKALRFGINLLKSELKFRKAFNLSVSCVDIVNTVKLGIKFYNERMKNDV